MPFKNKEDRQAWQRTYKKQRRAEQPGYNPSPGKRRAAKKQAKEEPPKKPAFIAIDGEGTNRSDGTQDYTLMNVFDPTYGNKYIERYDNGGLDTETIFRFLLQWVHTPNHVVYVGYFINYDVTKWLRDLTWAEKKALWNGNWVLWRGPSGTLYYIQYLPSKIFMLGEYNGHGNLPLNLHKDVTNMTRIYDVSGFFQSSFVKALSNWGIAEKDLDFIEEMKAKRNDFLPDDKQRIRLYCQSECELLVRLMNALADSLWGVGLYLRSWHGAGAVANEMFKVHQIQDYLEEPPDEAQAAVMGAYFGGRVEIFQQGEFPEGVYDYDLQSAYPSAAIHLPNLRDATWRHTTDYDPGIQFAVWRVRWCTHTDAHCLHPDADVWRAAVISPVGPLPFRHRGRVSFPFCAGYTWIHAHELGTALRLYGPAHFEVSEGWVLEPADDYEPFSFLDAMAATRIRYKAMGDARHQPLKLGMNSVYGKLAQNQIDPNKKPPYLSYYLAGLITARTRSTILQAGFVSGNSVVMIATDGLFTTTPRSDLPFGTLPGTWEDAGQTGPLLAIRPGVAYTADGSFIKTRGYGKKTLTYDMVKTAWDTDGPNAIVHYQERRFIGLGGALSTNRAKLCGRWLLVDRQLRFELNDPKVYNSHFPYNRLQAGYRHYEIPGTPGDVEEKPHRYRIVPRSCIELESAPYVPAALADETLAEELLENQLAVIEHYDQPDFEDGGDF